MRKDLKNFILNTVTNVTEISWEEFVIKYDGHYTRNSFIKKNEAMIKDILKELCEEFYEQNFEPVTPLIMAVD